MTAPDRVDVFMTAPGWVDVKQQEPIRVDVSREMFKKFKLSLTFIDL